MTNFEVKEDSRSLNIPGWDSSKLGLPVTIDRNSKLEGKVVYLRTNKAIYSRALVIKDYGESVIVRFVRKTDKKDGIVKETDPIQKRDIKDIRVYQE